MLNTSKRLSQGLGKITEVTELSHGLQLGTDFGKLDIQAYGQQVIRVHAYRNKPNHHSYAIIDQPSGSIHKTENEEKITLSTGYFKLNIIKSNSQLQFLTQDDQVINEDDPAFGISWIGEQVTGYKKLQPEERFLGLGEKTGPLDRKGKAYQNWNTDQYAYGSGTDPLYSSVPFYIGIHSGLCYGIYLDNSNKTHFNFGASNDRFSSFSADRGDLNYYFIYGQTVAEVIQQ